MYEEMMLNENCVDLLIELALWLDHVNDIKCWYTIIGAILNMIMFLVISIPMLRRI